MFLKLLKFFLYAAVFCVILVSTSTFFPFIGVKYYFFRIIIDLALICFLLWWAFEAKAGEVKESIKQALKKPLVLAVSVFVLFYMLAVVFAFDPHGAFWSNFERGEGGFQMIHYFIFFFLLILNFKEEKDWKLLFKLSLVSAGLMILYGFLAQTGLKSGLISPYQGNPPVGFWARLTVTRFQGSLGNPAYVAPYLMFSIFFSLYLWFTSNLKNKIAKISLYSGLIIIFLFFFVLSQTRGAFIGLAVGCLLSLVLAIFLIKKHRTKIVVSLGIILLLGALLVVFRNNPIIKKIPGARLLETADLIKKSDTIQTRLWTWGSAWEGFKDRPLLGWGPENFSTVFDLNFNPQHYVPGRNSETWFDRAHSIIFDYLATTGFLGFISYLGIFVAFFLALFRVLKNKISDLNHSYQVPLIALFGIVVGYLVQGLALFDVLPIYLNLFIILAFSVYFLEKNNRIQ